MGIIFQLKRYNFHFNKNYNYFTFNVTTNVFHYFIFPYKLLCSSYFNIYCYFIVVRTFHMTSTLLTEF